MDGEFGAFQYSFDLNPEEIPWVFGSVALDSSLPPLEPSFQQIEHVELKLVLKVLQEMEIHSVHCLLNHARVVI